MLLPAMFHWSPADRFDEILREGLRPHAPPTVCRTTSLCYVCLSPSPSRAWSLSGGMDWVSDIDDWDLWQVRLADGDDVRIRPDFGPEIQEVKVHGPIPADRIWWVARRGATPATVCLEVPAQPVKKTAARKANGRAGKR